MKSILAALLVSLMVSFAPQRQTVYICKGPQSTKYHLTPKCRGLADCSTKTFEVSLQEARGLNRTLCGWED